MSDDLRFIKTIPLYCTVVTDIAGNDVIVLSWPDGRAERAINQSLDYYDGAVNSKSGIDDDTETQDVTMVNQRSVETYFSLFGTLY